ncbi:MAG: helix-turn-helix transcriptional regulator [Candidatus Dadabacteria bacterium]|nr:helix-turn-helix transcriptional regulator [Candidatus Dadabacteria bacterium]NIS10066.1 helix-turn-helix transcriptional regulator [Candidatus Dadabacteria bacterium]NIV42143.1 helix-turn-helix domain-containing protein [Candidatus Dadabacteria bacterium]NIX16452.1 helix-turn-helix domain-containing protein [Candidatus Dadabacteria bacterium]NIY23013.1 helix-turn-helix domain-containing protein [Candidatus Dadabacteria bacterium]
MHTGQRIKTIRAKHSLTQHEFSKRIGISPNYLSELETGKAKPSKPVLLALEHKFGVSYDWLVKGKGPESVQIDNKLNTEEREILSILRKNRELYQTVKNLSKKYIKNKKTLGNLSDKINISKEQALLLLTTVDKIKSRSKAF